MTGVLSWDQRLSSKGTMRAQPFDHMPTAIEIGHYFIEVCVHRPQSWDGYDLYREDDDYCYFWVQGHFDFDYMNSWLLEVRTWTEGREVRDLLYVSYIGGSLQVQWKDSPSHPFLSSVDQWQDYMAEGLKWFTECTTSDIVDRMT